MYKMCHNIEIGAYRLKLVESVRIVRSVEALADTAEVVLPGMVQNMAIEVEDKIHVGDTVRIQLGYNQKLRTEFEGYVQRIGTDGGSLKVECEDAIYQLRQPVADKEYKNVDVAKILKDVLGQCKGLGSEPEVSCDYSFSYEKFTVHNATAYDVVKKIQEEVKPNIYMKPTYVTTEASAAKQHSAVLHVHPKYSEVFGEVHYDFSHNIERGGTSLEYRRKEDRRVLVVVEGEKRDGTKLRVEEGTTGGERLTLRVPGATDEASLRKVAQQLLEERCYTGYSGSFQGWLWPYCDAGYKVAIKDPDYEYKDGTYYATAVETTYSRSGGVRKITLGKRLN